MIDHRKDACERGLKWTREILMMKALGKLAALIEEADHDYATTFPKEELAKYLADLVICAHRMANKNTTGPIDMEAAILARMEIKMGTGLPEEEDVEGTACIRCGWDMQTELVVGLEEDSGMAFAKAEEQGSTGILQLLVHGNRGLI